MRILISKCLRSIFQPFIIWVLKKPLNRDGITYCLTSSTFLNSSIDQNVKLNLPYQISNVEIGSYTYISKNSEISYATIGKFCSIGPNFFCGWGYHPINGISTSPMFYSTRKQNGISLSDSNKVEERKQIIIGNDVFIGANVTILDGITIGDGAVIGAGSVVTKDIPPYSVAYGVPIQILKKRFDDVIINQIVALQWWNKPELLLEIERYFFQVDLFIEKYKNNEQ